MTVKLMEFVSDFGNGGTERQFVNLGLALEPSRFSVSFGCLHRWGRHLEEIDSRGIPVHDYSVLTFRDPGVLRAQLRLARDVRRFKIQIVHTYNFYANMFAIMPAKLAGARVVASIRDLGVYLSPAKRKLQRYACRLADHILVNANAIKEELVAHGYDTGHVSVIPNGIDVDRFARRESGALQREFAFPADAKLIGVVGRVTRFKGIESFLHAAALVAKEFPAARFVIVGDGVGRTATLAKDAAYFRELNQLVAELGIQDRVVFTGFRADVESIFADLTISVQPSLSEGLSNVVLEAMAARAPVIATRVGGTAEAIEDGVTGLLVPPADPQAIANAMRRLLAAPAFAKQLGDAARERARERFSIDRLANDTGRFYESLLQKAS
ncbi:MAG TPA: glycosyltransferase [Thermoanaerobaculia bacterium]|nr:glycosyltransferase [Thermoanaerobaculia bacterium]